MTNIVRIKRRAAGGAAGAPSSLENAELAYNEQDDVLYYGKGSGGAGGTASQVVAVGGPGAYATKDSPALTGTPTAPTPTTADSTTKIATTAFVKAQGYLAGNQTITVTGDATGSGATSVALTLAASGATAGTYKSVTVDTKGRVTAGTNPTTLAGYGITDAQALDADLTAIAALAGTTGLLKKTAANTWALDTAAYLTAITSGQVTTALGFTPENAANKGAVNGYAGLDGTGKVPSTQLPSFVDDVLEYANLAGFPGTGETSKIYVALDTNKTYRWSGSVYIEISASPGSTDSVAEGSVNLYFTNARASAAAPVQSVAGRTGAVTLAKADVGLANVENTALSTFAGSANITTLGTVATGTWNATAIGVTKGGLGLTAAVTGLLKGNGTAYSAAVSGTDYMAADATLDGGTF